MREPARPGQRSHPKNYPFMQENILTILSLFFILFSFGCLDEDATQGTLLVRCTNGTGLGFGGVTVMIMPGGQEKTTDPSGQALFAGISTGNYTISADDPDFGAGSVTSVVIADQTVVADLVLRDTTNTPPSISIRFPSRFGLFEGVEGDRIGFQARINDNSRLTLNEVVWESNLSGILRRSSPDEQGINEFVVDTLPPGDHFITATVTDPGGLNDTDSMLVTIIESPRAVTLLSVEETNPGPGPKLTWSAYQQEGFRTYEVIRNIEGDGQEQRTIATLQNIQDTTFSDPTLNYGQSATYTVFNSTDYGNSPHSNELRHQAANQLIDLTGITFSTHLNDVRRELYVLDNERNKVMIVDLETMVLVSEITTIATPNDLVTNPPGDSLFVIGGGSSFVDVIDLDRRQSARRINTANQFNLAGSFSVVFAPLPNHRLVVGNLQNQTGLLVISSLTGEVLGEVADGNNYKALATRGNTVFASSGFGDQALRSYRIPASHPPELVSQSGRITQGGLFLKVVNNGQSVIHGNRRYRANDLSTVEGTFSRIIRAASLDGSFAFANDRFFDANIFVSLRDLSINLRPLEYDDRTGMLYAAISQSNIGDLDQIVALPIIP